jgi:hypothetical protein
MATEQNYQSNQRLLLCIGTPTQIMAAKHEVDFLISKVIPGEVSLITYTDKSLHQENSSKSILKSRNERKRSISSRNS